MPIVPLFNGEAIESHQGEKKIPIYSMLSIPKGRGYSLEKRQDLLPAFLKVLLDVGFDPDSRELMYYFAVPKETDDPIDGTFFEDPFSEKYLSIANFEDLVIHFSNDHYNIEVIFFRERVTIHVRAIEDKIIAFGNALLEFAEMVSPSNN